MELEQARKRAAELRAVIEKNNRLYYDQDAPELEDYEYDQLTRELKTIEAQFPQLVTPDSPTQHVGGTPSGKFSKVAHAVKMESLQDAFSLDELREFDQRVREAGVTPEYVVEIKIDGRDRKPCHHQVYPQRNPQCSRFSGSARRSLYAA